MTVTPFRIPRHEIPRHEAAGRRSRVRESTGRESVSLPPAPAPAPLTVRFEVTLDGESRHRDAAEVLEALQHLADRLDSATVRVSPELAADAPGLVSAGAGAATRARWAAEAVDPSDQVGHPGGPETAQTVLISTGSRTVAIAGVPVELTRVEFDLLHFLARHPRRVFTRAHLLQLVWGYSHAGERTVDVHIRRLRAKLGEVPLVTTVRGVGYRLAEEADLRVHA